MIIIVKLFHKMISDLHNNLRLSNLWEREYQCNFFQRSTCVCQMQIVFVKQKESTSRYIYELRELNRNL